MPSQKTKNATPPVKAAHRSELHRLMAGKNRRFEDSRKKREAQQRRQYIHEQLN